MAVRHLLSFFLVSIFSFSGWAQDYISDRLTPRHLKAPAFPSARGLLKSENSHEYYEKMSVDFAAHIDSTYERLLAPLQNKKTFQCEAASGFDFVRALKTAGHFEECINVAESCLVNKSVWAQKIWIEGASCADRIAEFDRAYRLFNQATQKNFSSENDFPVAVYRFALFAWTTQYDSEVSAILARHWSGADIKLMKALIEYLNKGVTSGYSAQTLDAKTFELMGQGEEFANEMAIGWLNHLIWNHYDAEGSIRFLEKNISKIHEVERSLRTTNLAFYRLDQAHFKVVKNVLDAYYRHANPYFKYSVEDNIFTVTEQYEKICPMTLSQGDVYAQLQGLKTAWKEGRGLQQVQLEVSELNQKNPDRADILTFLGTLNSALGQEKEAFGNYWKAHQLCPYYHRSHWGLGDIIKNRRYRAFKDYQAIRERVKEDLQSIQFPESLSTYIMNWKTLTAEQVQGVKHALKFFASFVDGLVLANTRLYIKQVFEFESEIPGYEEDRDVRGDAPDNRLFDELRGRGGNPVISDLGETLRTPHGDYNLGAHEIAHSWHLDYLEAMRAPHLQACITKLYDGAKARNVFAEPYSASHETEYFAQAVGYYLIPSGAPARYGLTVDWLKEFDKDMFDFLVSIEASEGRVEDIHCPLN